MICSPKSFQMIYSDDIDEVGIGKETIMSKKEKKKERLLSVQVFLWLRKK